MNHFVDKSDFWLQMKSELPHPNISLYPTIVNDTKTQFEINKVPYVRLHFLNQFLQQELDHLNILSDMYPHLTEMKIIIDGLKRKYSLAKMDTSLRYLSIFCIEESSYFVSQLSNPENKLDKKYILETKEMWEQYFAICQS